MKVYVIGFNKEEVEELKRKIGEVICIPEYCRDWVLASIISQEKLEGRCNWHLRKFVIIHGGSKDDIEKIIRIVKSKFKDVIFATTSPTTLTWRLEDLLKELIREHEYLKIFKFKLHH
ncbi:DUF3783 domain-containing protein [Pyrococcus sp. ST04]|uniref:DUF3783 domain-containing protein n=1 Tax=Pyrococcus sp. ST04 TaxID=1183377 RepID=UPI0002605DB3|nr:DUF3783 domain-containing protein [Pyrococcus sp. ST04]AFK23106.1 hypothetical protein Py04_1535 [Pyrococcus sp. ST04]